MQGGTPDGFVSRVIADALGIAAETLAQEAEYGRLHWEQGGLRCYGRQRGDDACLTIVGAQYELTYIVVGVPLEALA